MKQLTLSAFLFSISIHLFAQNTQVFKKDVIIGKVITDNHEIKATEYIFPQRIASLKIDSTRNIAAVTLRDLTRNKKFLKTNGDFVLYDLKNESVKWTKEINFNLNGISFNDHSYFKITANNNTYLDPETGLELWTEPNDIYYTNRKLNIGLGYKYNVFKGDFTNSLEGIDLSTGKTLWKKDIKRNFGWNAISLLNDSTLLIAASGLHRINLITGEGWDYNAVTGRNDYKAMIAANMLGIAAGVLTGTYFTRDKDVVSGLVSNILNDRSAFIFASREKLSSIDSTGKINWETVLDKELTSKSNISINENDILLVNFGYAYFNNQVVDYGTPYFASFDKETGKQKYMITVGDKKESINVADFNTKRTQITLFFDNKISLYNLNDGRQLSLKPFDSKKYGIPKFTVDKNLFITNTDGSLQNINQKYQDKTVLITSTNKILILDSNFDVIETFDWKDMSALVLEHGNHFFIRKDKKTRIYNKDLKLLAETDLESDADIVGDYIYSSKENSLYKVNLNLLNNL